MSSNQEREPLTKEEIEWAKHLGMTPEHYADMKTIRNIDEWNAYVELKEQGGDDA